LDIPSDSEDSVLSDSCDEDESDMHEKAQKRLEKLDVTFSSKRAEAVHPKTSRKSHTWKDGSMLSDTDATRFTSDSSISSEIMELETPLQFFKYLFTDEIVAHIVEHTILYAVQECPENALKITTTDIERFIGICMYMSINRFSSCRNYWSIRFRVNYVADVMTYNSFAKIKRFLHFSNNELSTDDRLVKVRPVVDMLRRRFQLVPFEEHLSIDEQIIPFKGRHGLKQYMPKKPHKWGYKVYVLSGVSGYAYDIEVYSGKDDNKLLPGETDCGACGNVVVRLSRYLPENSNFKVYFDNYFNSPDLQVALAQRGILSLGTVRTNRVHNLNGVSDGELKKRGRGAYAEKIALVGDTKMSVVRWFDNRPVTFLSTFVGAQPVCESRRWNKAQQQYEQVVCPKVVQIYNKHMGGVDLLDSLIGLYRTKIRSKKWYHRIFHHLLDLTVVNAWLLYKRCFIARFTAGKVIRLQEFKWLIAEGLCQKGRPDVACRSKKRGRPLTSSPDMSSAAEAVPAKRSKPPGCQPCDDARFDGYDHWPRWSTSRQRCKRSGCKCLSRVYCSKCRVSLCFNSKQDCFFEYHHVK